MLSPYVAWMTKVFITFHTDSNSLFRHLLSSIEGVIPTDLIIN